jgi:signal transduction histidine kinase
MAAVLATALLLSLTAFAGALNDYAYDFLFRLLPPKAWSPQSIILAIDEPTLTKYSGVIRGALAAGLERIAAAKPAATAIDIVLADNSPVPGMDDALEKALAETPNAVLACELLGEDSAEWEYPVPRFRKLAASLGEVHADISKYDAISRDVPLEKAQTAAPHIRHWVLGLAAWAVAKNVKIEESPDELIVGGVHIPSRRRDGRIMRVRYAPQGVIPKISVVELERNPSLAAQFAGKTVFIGVTAQTAMRDRWMTPLSNSVAMSGIEINANIYETIEQRLFLTDTPSVLLAAVCIGLAATIGLVFVFTSGWTAYSLALLPLLASQVIPGIAFANASVLPWLPATLTAAGCFGVAAAWKQVRGRRELIASEQQKTAYQHAIQFVTHEMRTPLTAIQGSSELIGRYGSMPEAKRQQMAQLINSESKRLSRMIEAFLSVERLSAGQMDLKQEQFALPALVDTCVERARPIAERKRIAIDLGSVPNLQITGDRELMEYAIYNLLTNAVKYSPPETRVTVYGDIREAQNKEKELRLSVRDQGIGMDRKEVSRIFEKFYRTRRAEQSGEAGTGIGLSIVEQIVTQHGGRIQVESEPGKGSVFTVILRQAASDASRHHVTQ